MAREPEGRAWPGEVPESDPRVVAMRAKEVRREGLGPDAGYGLRAMSAIHTRLYGDTDPDAGVPRDKGRKWVGAGKQEAHFAAVRDIPRLMDDVDRYVRDQQWDRMNRQETAAALGQVYAHVAHARPMRGNETESLRVFVDRVAAHSHYSVRWDQHTDFTWESATLKALPAQKGGAVDATPFGFLLESSLKRRVLTRPEPMPENPATSIATSHHVAPQRRGAGDLPEERVRHGASPRSSHEQQVTSPIQDFGRGRGR